MVLYNMEQVAKVAYAAGFRGEALAFAIAIARGESGWQTRAHGDTELVNTTWGPSIGLFQIRSVNADDGSGAWRDASQLTDPYFNARAAFAISSGGTNFQPWTVYKNDSYLSFLDEARTFVAGKETRGIFQPADPTTQFGTLGSTGAGNNFSASGGPMTESDELAYARENFGWVAGFLDHPELGDLIHKATAEQWTFARLEAELQATDFWKTTEESVRDFEARRLSDPATVDAEIREITLGLQNKASRLGLTISAERAGDLALEALKFGWTARGATGWNLDGAEISAALAAEMQYSPGVDQVGTLGALADQIRVLAADYLVSVSDQSVFDWTQEVLSQGQTLEGIEQVFQQRAIAKFPHLTDQIGNGVKPATVFEDYRQLVQSELGETSDSVDLVNDTRFSSMLSTSDSSGGTRIMSIPEATSYLRNLGGNTGQFSRMPQAHNRVAEFRQGIEQMFGVR